LRTELSYVDYLGALERFRIEKVHRPDVLRMSSWLVIRHDQIADRRSVDPRGPHLAGDQWTVKFLPQVIPWTTTGRMFS
jgi:hypothetical protein